MVETETASRCSSNGFEQCGANGVDLNSDHDQKHTEQYVRKHRPFIFYEDSIRSQIDSSGPSQFHRSRTNDYTPTRLWTSPGSTAVQL